MKSKAIKKPADKVEPKFKVGDRIVGKTNNIYTVICVIDDEYRLSYNIDDSIVCAKIKTIDKKCHLWTIQDAKDGDVLHCWIDGDEFVLIYKGIKDGYITTYGHLYQGFKLFSEEPTTMFCRTTQGHFTPTTKEQRDLLFQKMKEAGYEWDAEKKELKKIEHNHDDWSEDDETTLNSILSCIKYCQYKDEEAQYNGNHDVDPKRYEPMFDLLKSLKERVQQKRQERFLKRHK